MEYKYINNNNCICMFINLYCIHYFWKKAKTKTMPELYELFYATGKRTKFNRILRLEVSSDKLVKDSDNLAKVTGLDKKYFTGDKFLSVPGLIRDDWEKYIYARREKQNIGKHREMIHSKLDDAYNSSNGNQDLKIIIAFAKTGVKWVDNSLEEIIDNIRAMLITLSPKHLEKMAEDDNLKKLEEILREHLNRVTATRILYEYKTGES